MPKAGPDVRSTESQAPVPRRGVRRLVSRYVLAPARRRLLGLPGLYRIWQRFKETELYRRWAKPGTSPRALRRHARLARTSDRSHAGEAEHLLSVLAACGIGGGFVVDLAAGDGVTHSPTLSLFRNPAWSGLAVEMDPVHYRRLSAAYREFGGVHTLRARVTPDNVESLLEEAGVPDEFEVLNLDLDSYDLYVVEALLRSFRPSVMTMEVNEKVPPPIRFSVLYDPDHVWAGDHFFGCSLSAAADVVKPRGYVLESLEYNNAFFVRSRLAEGIFPDRSAKDAYDAGYRSRPDRLDLFPWNHDVDHLLRLPPRKAARVLELRFQKYRDRFVLEFPEQAR